MAREDWAGQFEAAEQWRARRSRRLLRKRHLSKQERCELAELRALDDSEVQPQMQHEQ